jgi:prevent-host-death family protein
MPAPQAPRQISSAISARRTDHYNGHMTRQMTATEFKARALALLDEVATGDEIEITKHGRTVARLVGARGPLVLRGQLAGVARSVADDQSLFSTEIPWDLP